MTADTILLYFISFLIFLILLWLAWSGKGLRLFDDNGFVVNRSMLIVLHISGITLFGLFPLISKHFSSFDFFNRKSMPGLSTCVSISLAVASVFFMARIADRKISALRPGVPDSASMRPGFVISYLFVRLLFICAYENWFRGYLLNDCIAALGIPMAVVLNIVLYMLLHLVNGKEEVVACVPFGLLLCTLCIWQGATWPAVLIHLTSTVSFEVRVMQKVKNLKNALL